MGSLAWEPKGCSGDTQPEKSAPVAGLEPHLDEFPEVKIMAGFLSARDAQVCFQHHYDNPLVFGRIRRLSVEQFLCVMEECRTRGVTLAP